MNQIINIKNYFKTTKGDYMITMSPPNLQHNAVACFKKTIYKNFENSDPQLLTLILCISENISRHFSCLNKKTLSDLMDLIISYVGLIRYNLIIADENNISPSFKEKLQFIPVRQFITSLQITDLFEIIKEKRLISKYIKGIIPKKYEKIITYLPIIAFEYDFFSINKRYLINYPTYSKEIENWCINQLTQVFVKGIFAQLNDLEIVEIEEILRYSFGLIKYLVDVEYFILNHKYTI